MGADWFRNTTWSEAVERTFNEKLQRARRKENYLRIQACTLARSHPDVALRLLDRYFSLKDDFDHAQAYVDRATALLTLGRIDEAVESYSAALAREVVFPNLLTQAYLGLAIPHRHARHSGTVQLREAPSGTPQGAVDVSCRSLSLARGVCLDRG